MIVACIPCYNEEKTVAKVILQAEKFVDKVLICDDGSSDMTAEIAKRLGAEVIVRRRNMGYGYALASLFERARSIGADVVVTLDGDGQHDPRDIPRLIQQVVEGRSDVCIGSRYAGPLERIPRYRSFGIKVITNLTDRVTGLPIKDAQSGFRAYSKRVIESLTPTEAGMGASTEIIMKAAEKGFTITEVPVPVSYKVPRPSTHTPVFHGLDVIASTIKHLSIRHPLVFYGIPAIILILVGAGFTLWVTGTYVSQRIFVTNIALVAIATVMAGLILGVTAIILFVIISVVRER